MFFESFFLKKPPLTKKEIIEKKKKALKLPDHILSIEFKNEYDQLYNILQAHYFLTNDIEDLEKYGEDNHFNKLKKKEKEIKSLIHKEIEKFYKSHILVDKK